MQKHPVEIGCLRRPGPPLPPQPGMSRICPWSPLLLHTDAGVPVYMYEFQHRPEIYKDTRPSFVKADHGDELGFVFGACFWNGHVKLNGKYLSSLVYNYIKAWRRSGDTGCTIKSFSLGMVQVNHNSYYFVCQNVF